MIQLSVNRSALLLSILLLTLLSAAACSSSGENTTRSNNNAATANAPAAATPASATNTGNAVKAKINLNTASDSEFLAAVPNLGNKMAHEFEEYRPYKSIQQFRREMGKYVKPEQIAEYEKYVFVPISPNEADAATLQQIPGLDATEAQALIAARPYASNDAFLAKLTPSVSAEELAVARTYLSN
jgi:DNA uptake protein ComE-like DNA-binding protein